MDIKLIEQLLWDLLFKDMEGKPYDDRCSQNVVIRKWAKKYGVQIINHQENS